jgi:hypothetical protein
MPLRRVPYRDMLADLFGDTGGMVAPSVPVVTRAYEVKSLSVWKRHTQFLTESFQESYMREPIDSTERPCVMGERCECTMVSRECGFVGVEFILPNERQGATRQMCVLCHRKLVQGLFHDIIYGGAPYRGVIQRYGNICGHQVTTQARLHRSAGRVRSDARSPMSDRTSTPGR